MRKQKFTAISLCLAGLATAPALPAQTLDMANSPAVETAVAKPGPRQTVAHVKRQFGAPTERFAAIGQPPITRWVYADKIVFFEYDHVVHAVTLRR